jgi:FkbM family methyltransferase
MIGRLGRSVMRRLRRVADIPPMRTFLERPAIERVVSVFLRSSTVRAAPLFVLRELPSRHVLARYRLREGDFDVLVRHGTADIATLDEVFYSREYDFPDPVRRALDTSERSLSVVDLGANIGLFDLWVLRHFPDALVTAVEPDPSNLEVLRQCVALNDHTGRWTVIEAAASNRGGTVSFAAGGASLSRIEPEGGNLTVEMVDIFPYLERADLIKIDIEGGEWAILTDPRFRELAPAGVVLEYHPHLAPDGDPAAIARSLVAGAGAGLHVQPISQFGPGHGMLWAWRPE